MMEVERIGRFDDVVFQETGRVLRTTGISTIQVNVGLRCNQACTHCHLSASPLRTEMMGQAVMREVIRAAGKVRPQLVDITGGAPEYNPNLPYLLKALKDDGHRVQVRTNLTVLEEEGMDRVITSYLASGVKLVASLPCFYRPEVDSVRGEGVFDRSIRVLKRLNELGFGVDRDLQLDLVFNPEDDLLPGEQSSLQARYKEILGAEHGLAFNDLLTIANMPVGRFRDRLVANGTYERYMDLLRSSFNPRTIDRLMCLSQIDVGWDGEVYDCDFNLALGRRSEGGMRVGDLDPEVLADRRIVTGDHCFGCTAGQGSSCGGALDGR